MYMYICTCIYIYIYVYISCESVPAEVASSDANATCRMCRADAAEKGGREHPRHALVLFNLGYITRVSGAARGGRVAGAPGGAGGSRGGSGEAFRAAGLFSLSLRYSRNPKL